MSVNWLAINSIQIILHQLFNEQISTVTFDNQSGRNKIRWEKSPSAGIKEYRVLKESSKSGEFIAIDTVSYLEEGI